MSALTAFLNGLFSEGEAVVTGKPAPTPHDPEALQLLEQLYTTVVLDLAGPPLPFLAPTALQAATLLWQSCWYLLEHSEPDEVLKQTLQWKPPRNVSEHFCTDLTFRYLPDVLRRAQTQEPLDQFNQILTAILRAWPLSGVLAAIDESPTTPLDFGGHPGLQLLYAERLANQPRTAWLPPNLGPLELVWQELGRDPARLRALQTPLKELDHD